MAPPAPKPAPQRAARTASPPAATALSRALATAARELSAVLDGESLAARKSDSSTAAAEALRAQIHEILYGTLRRFGEGDAILAHLVDRPLDTPVRALLLVALYRLCSSPETAHTTVDQAVDAAPLCEAGRAGGLINAVLRNFLRQRDRILASPATDDVAATAHPRWWLTRLREAYPDDWQAIVDADNRQPPITLRVNPRRQTVVDCCARLHEEGIAAVGLEGFPQAIRLTSPGRIDRLPGYREGNFSVQDPAAQRAAVLLAPEGGDRVLDACAAPGGKSTHLLELADIDLTALDLDATRCQRIEENLARQGLSGPRVRVVVGDAARADAWWDGRLYDRILADVPCTASGVVRRHPDAKWLRREPDIARFAAQQQRILAALWSLLVPGGRLLYATCSLFPEENDQQISSFLAARADARLQRREQWLPNDMHDGFFYALVEKAVA